MLHLSFTSVLRSCEMPRAIQAVWSAFRSISRPRSRGIWQCDELKRLNANFRNRKLVSKMDKTRIARYQIAKQLYGL